MNIQLTEVSTPTGGYDIYRKEFRWMKIEDIEKELQETMQQAMKCGYNSFLFCRATGTVHMHKREVKTLDDVFLTDPYKLLDDSKPQTATQTTIF